jgi:hypothetical protein
MHEPLAMEVGQGLGDRRQDRDGFANAERAPAADQLTERSPRCIVHDDPEGTVGGTRQPDDVVNPHQVVMVKCREDPGFAAYSILRGFACPAGVKTFHRELATGQFLADQPDGGSAAATQLAPNVVARHHGGLPFRRGGGHSKGCPGSRRLPAAVRAAVVPECVHTQGISETPDFRRSYPQPPAAAGGQPMRG